MFQETWHRLMKNKGAVIGMAFLAFLVVVALVSPFVFDYETDVIGQNLANKLQAPNSEHWFGTDEYGRDLFARVMYGARYSLAIGIGSVGFGLVVGTILGSIAGFYGGKADDIIMRGIDIFYSIPNILKAVVIVSLLGTSTINLIIALAISCATNYARIVRASVMTGSQELDVVCYILVVSIGLSVLFNMNASSGGLDIVAKIMNKYLHMEIGKAMSLSGMCVALSAALVYDKKTVGHCYFPATGRLFHRSG